MPSRPPKGRLEGVERNPDQNGLRKVAEVSGTCSLKGVRGEKPLLGLSEVLALDECRGYRGVRAGFWTPTPLLNFLGVESLEVNAARKEG